MRQLLSEQASRNPGRGMLGVVGASSDRVLFRMALDALDALEALKAGLHFIMTTQAARATSFRPAQQGRAQWLRARWTSHHCNSHSHTITGHMDWRSSPGARVVSRRTTRG